MAIISSNSSVIPNGVALDTFVYPDQFCSQEDKLEPKFWKENLDYWNAIAFSQYRENESIVKNYRLLAGEFDFNDYNSEDVDPFINELMGSQNSDIPRHLRHYPILNSPINTLQGELIKRPDTSKIKAIDQNSKNEFIAAKEELIKGYISQMITSKVSMTLAQRGVDLQTEEGQQELQQMTLPQIEEYMRKSYSDPGEQWGNNTINACKDYLRVPEKSEKGFKDLLVSSMEFHEILPDLKSPLGIRYSTLNPALVWKTGHPNAEYSDEFYAVGTIDRLDISQIVNMFDLPEKDVKHLINIQKNSIGFGPTNLMKGQGTGERSIHYNTYNPLVYQAALLNPDVISPEKRDPFVFNLSNSAGTFMDKFVVVQAYWQSKRKKGKRSYFDEDGNLQSMMVDENYKPILKPIFKSWVKRDEDKIGENLIEGELVEWAWFNEWWGGVKIGSDIYHANRLAINQCPIVGIIHNNLNAKPNSMLGLMKPLQTIFNIAMNQLYELMGKEQGKTLLMSLRHIPAFKDLGDEDALAVWEENAIAKGIVFIDDSPENLGGTSSFNTYNALDLTRSQEMQSRLNIALEMKLMCWELVGISKERLGQVAATQTATGTNAALSQSYSQTEPLFRAHETVMQRVYQLLLDTAKWVETQNPESMLSHINSDFENVFVKINSEVLATKDLMIFVTNSGKDLQTFNKLQSLAEVALQNGADLLSVMEMFDTDSKSKLKNVLTQLKETNDKIREQEAQLAQDQLRQNQEALEKQLAQNREIHDLDQENDNLNKELDRISKKEIAIINSFSRQDNNLVDNDTNGIPDILEVSRLDLDEKLAYKEHDLKLKDIQSKEKQSNDKLNIELEKLKLEKEKIKADKEKVKIEAQLDKANQKNDEKIARINLQGRKKDNKKK